MREGNRLVVFFVRNIFYYLARRVGQTRFRPILRKNFEDAERYRRFIQKFPARPPHQRQACILRTSNLEIQALGVGVEFVTLHVGLGTFRPVKEREILNHHMHSEHISLSAQTAKRINEPRARGGRVIAVGTTSCRTLEACAQKGLPLQPVEGYTDLFLYPGKQFLLIDGLITNFHLPESTLLMLVCAFAGVENTFAAYREAICREYRFFSFGDAMFIAGGVENPPG